MGLLSSSNADAVVYAFGRSEEDPEKTADIQEGARAYVTAIQDIISKYGVDPKRINLGLLSYRQINFLSGIPKGKITIEKINQINVLENKVWNPRTLLHVRDQEVIYLNERIQMYCAHLPDAEYHFGTGKVKSGAQIDFDLGAEGAIFITLETLLDKELR